MTTTNNYNKTELYTDNTDNIQTPDPTMSLSVVDDGWRQICKSSMKKNKVNTTSFQFSYPNHSLFLNHNMSNCNTNDTRKNNRRQRLSFDEFQHFRKRGFFTNKRNLCDHPQTDSICQSSSSSNSLTGKGESQNKPIISYGIVLYTYEKNKFIKYLLCQRRDSIAFIHFMQNKIQEPEIEKYINLMSKEEKKRCMEYFYRQDPHTIWKDLWIDDRSRVFRQEYRRCTDIFLRNMEKYKRYFEDDSIGQCENSWGFPKGRRDHNESEIECALREFEEETNISKKDVTIIQKDLSFEENYIGSNGLNYRTVYFMAYIPYIPKKEYMHYPQNIRKKFISSEIYEMEWLDYSTAMSRLNSHKQEILTKINNFHLKKKF